MDHPIACTLPASELRTRTDELAALASRALRSRTRTPDGALLLFADDPGVESDLRAAVAAEAACCPFLRFALARRADGLALEVSGPPDAAAVIDALFA